MHAANSCLSSVSRRTRSRWAAFYRSEYDKINKKPDHEDDTINISGECVPNYEQENQDFETKDDGFLTSEDSSEISDESDDERSDTSDDSDAEGFRLKKSCKNKGSRIGGKPAKKRRKTTTEKARVNIEGRDVIDVLMESIWEEMDSSSTKEEPVRVEGNNAVCESILPLKFSLEFGEKAREKTEWEKEIDSLFDDLEMGLWECEADFADVSNCDDDCVIISATNDTQAHRCQRGEHGDVLDEQIGIVCKYCNALLLDIKYVLPDFHVESPETRERKDSEQSEPSLMNLIDHVQDSTCSTSNTQSTLTFEGTVQDLIPQSDKELYPHQLEGFEFLWRNIAGDTDIKALKKLPSDCGRGCIISHAPGTGKTRLTMVFLQTFMKLYPECRPLIIAPRGMLLTWEQEFKKWKVDIDFHNLNKMRLSDQETEIAAGFGDEPQDIRKIRDYIRLVKLNAWKKAGGILGISYRLFEELAGEHKKKRCSDRFTKILLELPGLIVMDEGHTPRNQKSLMWKAVTKIKSQRRVILSGTPFQNNFSELYNTLCLVNPAFSQENMSTSCNGKGNHRRRRKTNDAREEWSNLTSCISKKHNADDDDNDDRVKKLRSMMETFVHIHKGGILQKTLPGLRDCLVILKPTDLQTKLLKKIPSRVDKFLERDYLTSIISVHPSLVAEKQEFSDHKRKLKSIETNHNEGVKTRFLINLIQLSIRLNEKVLVFSEFIDPLVHIKSLLKSHFSWKEGREVIYMDGSQKIKRRQCLINCFNEKQGSAKVLLASLRACCEGISLVGASRVILLDVMWNPSVERQAICRAYRLGQEKTVHVYHLVTPMEAKKYARKTEKERISKLIFSPAAGEGENAAEEKVVSDDRVLEAMVRKKSIRGIVERIVHQPKESDFVDCFGFIES